MSSWLVAIGVMYTVAMPFYVRVREMASGPDGQAPDVAAMQAALATRRPEVLALVGGTGAIVLLWLMVVRPTWTYRAGRS